MEQAEILRLFGHLWISCLCNWFTFRAINMDCAGIIVCRFIRAAAILRLKSAEKRFNKFLDEFPNAVDIIVRGVKSGMPVGDCLQIAATEAKDPVGTEFTLVLDKMKMGFPLAEAIHNMPKRVPLQETNFLAIVITIQAQAGGSLSEALTNLSKTLRQRKEMKGKIRAVSQEAKSSAAIIGSLPFLVTLMLALVAPDYIRLLIDTDTGLVLIGIGLFWMTLGVLVMRKMIDFRI